MSVQPRPYPTPTRLRLMRAIAAGKVEHYPGWSETSDRQTGNLVTARVREFVDAGLAEYGEVIAGELFSIVALTETGREYLDAYGKNGADT